MLIRKAKLTDLKDLISLQRELVLYERKFDPRKRRGVLYYPRNDMARMIRSINANVLVALDSQEKITGCCLGSISKSEGWDASLKKGYIGMMIINAGSRGKGIGNMMMEKLLQWFRRRKITDVQLCVYPDNTVAKSFYKKFGFQDHLLYMRKLG